MKNIFKKLVIFLLKMESRLILHRHRPRIVAVTGTVGKTSAKEAIALALGTKFSIRKSEKNYNSEFGVPLTIIGVKSAWGNFFGWVAVLIKGIIAILIKKQDYPQWLVLEMGVDKPGDMSYFAKWIQPDVTVVTSLGTADGGVPVHAENFKNPEELAKEKFKLAINVKTNGWVALNGDDKAIAELRNKIRERIISYGFSSKNDLTASNYHFDQDSVSFKVDYKGNIFPVCLPKVIGKQYVYAVLAGLAVGLSQELNLVEMAEAMLKFQLLPGRMNLLEGINGSFILDDTYNASPVAVNAGMEVLAEFQALRRIAVLGDMLELGKFSIDEHKKIGRLIKEKNIDLLFAVGPRATDIAKEALQSGFARENIFKFQDSTEAGPSVKEKIQKGDIVLVKGSQSMRMEKIVKEIMAHPEDAEKLLVRQEPEWKKK